MPSHLFLPIPDELPRSWFVAATPDVYLSRRGRDILLVEPESASWLVLQDEAWELFALLSGRTVGTTTEKSHQLWQVGDLADQSSLGKAAFNRVVMDLFRTNMISVNGKRYFEPSRMWEVQAHPHYFNIHMTEACNLGCTYCRVSSPERAQLADPALVRRIVRRVIEESPLQSLVISFHGGEPLLNLPGIRAGAEEAATVAQACGKQVELLVQTNGTLLTPETVEALRRLKVGIGVSIDGPAPIHDLHRVDRGGEGSYERVAQGIRTVSDQGAPPGLLAVVHDPSGYVAIADHLVRTFHVTSLRVNMSSLEGRAGESLSFPADRGAAFARGWLSLLDYAEAYVQETGIWLDIADLNLFLFHLVSKERPHMCYRSPCGVGNSILGFSADGGMYLCDELVGEPGSYLGNIQEAGNLRKLLDSASVKADLMERRRVECVPKCAICPWKRFHGSGCANKAFRYFGTFGKEDPLCRFYSVIFEELMWRVHRNPSLLRLCNQYAQHAMGSEAVDSLIEAYILSITEQKPVQPSL